MTTQVNTLQWQKSLSLDRHGIHHHFLNESSETKTLPRLLHQPREIKLSELIIDAPPKNSSFLYSVRLKQNLLESRNAFLNLSEDTDKPQEETIKTDDNKSVSEISCQEQKKVPQKKISFKIKKTSSIYRRPTFQTPKVTTLSANTVAELTTKFNKMVAEKHSILDEPKFARLVRRVNSQKSVDDRPKVLRKPSIKVKPTFRIDDSQKRKPSVKRKISVNKVQKLDKTNSNDKMCVRAKISYLETPQYVKKSEINTDLNDTLTTPKINQTKQNQQPTTGTVKATIEIFEKRNSQISPIIESKDVPKLVPKPKVPEKNFTLIKKELKVKNSDLKLKVYEKHMATKLPEIKLTETVPEKTEENDEEQVQILSIPATLPQRRCDSMYETLNLKKVVPPSHLLKMAKSAEIIRNLDVPTAPIKPNTSFLWRRTSCQEKNVTTTTEEEDWESLYDTVQAQETSESKSLDQVPTIPPRPSSLNLTKPPAPPKIFKMKMPLPEDEDKLYEELGSVKNEADAISHNYEYCESPVKYEDIRQKNVTDDDGYEYCSASPKEVENIYEMLPQSNTLPLLPRRKEEPLPPRPPSRNSCSTHNGEDVSNCYESIYNRSQRDKDVDSESNYESIYGCQLRNDNWSDGSNRNSLVSSDQQSNSLYGRTSLGGWGEDASNTYSGKATSDLSSSDRSDEWIDMSDNEDANKENSGIVIVRERQKSKKTSGWSQKLREQWSKSPKNVTVEPVDSDSDHHYESLCNAQQESQDDDFDSFDSDTESENSFTKVNFNDSGVDIGNMQLPEPPNNQTYVLTRLAATAGKHMKRLRRNWSVTKNDITKSLSRMTKRKSRTDLDNIEVKSKEEKCTPTSLPKHQSTSSSECLEESSSIHDNPQATQMPYQNIQFNFKNDCADHSDGSQEKNKNTTSARKGFLNKFRRSMSMTAETANELTNSLNAKPKSTFYLTDTIDIDGEEKNDVRSGIDSGLPSSPIQKVSKNILRPQSPPPPAPGINSQIENRKSNKKDKRSTSWYAECGLFKGTENGSPQNRRPNTYWYAEVGLYQTSASTPSTSSAENSGSNVNVTTNDNSEEYFNLKNENDYYNESITSFSSGDTKMDQSFSNLSVDMQLRLQDEPLYQFYDAAVMESVCQGAEFDSDGYEEVGDKRSEITYTSRPSAMELVAPKKNSISVARTLWCEIPEVIQSSVLSTLSTHQRKLQEAKFEMITSEASYLNSLNVLTDHFISSLCKSDALTRAERDILFGKIDSVKDCSEKLLSELEKCWQDNILLHGVCDIILRQAEENFYVYISYCENQIVLDRTLKKLKERNSFNELLRQLETNSACQSLTLYSFLMLPMQRITRWPLLVDAVLKRLSAQDPEYLTCQYALATINKIVTQCNEGARKVERETEMEQIATQIEFHKNVPTIKLVSGSRWLVRSGSLTQMLPRNDETKLTFGRRFTKVPLHLFLFNDLLLVTKCKAEDNYVVQHYCSKSLVELSTTDTLSSLPVKDAQGRNLLFITLLENHEGKTVELLLSCNSESDKERWIEALSPPKSEDPDETLYECWDCPQVTAIHGYAASQPDELALCRGDIINVTRKMADGWYHGERIRDGQTGWFPANYTVEVVNPHVRARNLKQRYRLLAFSENYLKSK